MAKIPPKKEADKPAPDPAPAPAEQPSKSLDDLMKEIAAQGGPKNAPAPTADDHNKAAETIVAQPTRAQMLAELAKLYGTTPAAVEKMLSVDGGIKARAGEDPVAPIDLPLPDGTVLVPVKITHDYWAGKQVADQWPVPPDENGEGGDNRVVAGSTIKLPGVEARRLINEGKAVRNDPMPDEA